MGDTIARLFAILALVGLMVGAGWAVKWLASAWFKTKDVYLAIEPFEVKHGNTVNKEEGKELAQAFVKRIKFIDDILTAELSKLKLTEQFRIESAIPKAFALASEVKTTLDVEVKAFDVDLIGIYERVYKFFDPSDYLKVSVYINEKIKVFASAKSKNEGREIGPWWIADGADEQTAIEEFAYRFMLALYTTSESSLAGLTPDQFRKYVAGVRDYQEIARQAQDGSQADKDLLKKTKNTFNELAKATKSSVTLTYFASLCSLDDDIDQAETTYNKILVISPADAFALKELKRISDAKRLKPVQIAGAQKGNIEALRAELVAKGIRGYDVTRAPPSQRDIVVAVLGTGISSFLKDDIKDRLVDAISVVPDEADIIDSQGHGTAVISLVAALAPHAKIISIKCLDKNGVGIFNTIARGIDTAVNHKADLLVVPLGSGLTSPAIENSMKAALRAGILVVAAAGNDGEKRVAFPANITGVLSVGATNHQDVLTTFSNYGPVSLYAEGQDILVYGLKGEQLTQSGTSFSSAIVAAIAAATWSARPDNSSDQIKKLLIDTAIDISSVNEAKLRVAPLRRIDGLKAIAGQ